MALIESVRYLAFVLDRCMLGKVCARQAISQGPNSAVLQCLTPNSVNAGMSDMEDSNAASVTLRRRW